jgi:cobalt-zinc-cadmium efflux system outer membrane protein
MKRAASLVGAALLVLLVVPLARAQSTAERMTVDELIARALAAHPEIAATRLEVDAASARVQQAGLRPNPMLDIAGQKALGPDNNLMVGVTLPLDLNGRKEGRVGVAERELDVRRAQLAERERRLRADLRMKASEVLAARRNLGTTRDLLEINRRATDIVRARVRQGAAPALDENLLAVETNRLETSETTLGSRLDVLLLQLKTLAGLAPEAPLDLVGDLAGAGTLPDQGDVTRRAAQDRPDLAVARGEAAAAGARIRKEEAEGRWDASVNVGYQRQQMGFGVMGITKSGGMREVEDTFHYFGGGFTVTLPVRNRNQGNIAAARAEAAAAERRRDLLDLTVRQEIAAAYAQHAGARRGVDLYERGVLQVARRNVDTVRQAYELGRGSLLDIIAEQRRYIEIEAGYTDALKQLYDALAEVERATGLPLR